MSRYPRLHDELFVAPQISEADFAALAAEGVKAIVNNRPDGEDPTQIDADRGKALAEANGMTYHHIPVTAQTLSQAAAAAFADVLTSTDGPVLAHCRSGTRSTILWALGAVGNGTVSRDQAVTAGASVGVDVAPALGLLDRWGQV